MSGTEVIVVTDKNWPSCCNDGRDKGPDPAIFENENRQCCGSGIRCLFNPGYGIRDPDPGSQTDIIDILMTNFWPKSTIILSVLAKKCYLPVQK